MSVEIIEAPVEQDQTYRGEPGDEDLFSHFARKDEITASWMTGAPVTALCGKKWVPTRDPERFPVCPDCEWVMENIVGTNIEED